MAQIDGTSASDVLVDTVGDDVIDGKEANDTITITDGDDNVQGGAGDADKLIIAWGAATGNVTTGPGVSLTDGGSRSVFISGIERYEITTGTGDDNIPSTGALDDVVNLGGGNDILGSAGAGDDVVNGGSGDDEINVGAGDDTADGGTGIDRIAGDLSAAASGITWNLQTNFYSGPIGSFTNFEYFGGTTGSGTIVLGSGNDLVVTGTANLSDKFIDLGAGDDSITFVDGDDQADGGAGLDTLVLNWGAATTNVVRSFGLSFTDGGTRTVNYANFERFVFTTGSGNDIVDGQGGNDIFNLGSGNDKATTGAGNDIVNAGSGDDAVDLGTGDDTADGGTGTDWIAADLSAAASAIVWNLQTNDYSGPIGDFTNFEWFGGGGQGTVLLGSGNDVLVSGTANLSDKFIDLGSGDDSVTFVDGDDQADGGAGLDTLVLNWGAATGNVVRSFGISFTDGGTRTVNYSNFERFVFTTGSGNDIIDTQAGNDILNLGAGNDQAVTGAGADIVNGGDGNDTLDGGTGSDKLRGGTGDDSYVVDRAGDQVTELAGGGTDVIQSSATYTLPAEVENLVLTGTAAIAGTGNALANQLFGNSGDNVLNGLAGADLMQGENGNDIYFVDNIGDQAVETAFATGIDLVRSTVTFALGDRIENLTLAGAAAINGTGNSLNNKLTGNNAANVLDGGAGNDKMSGKGGDDTYKVDDGGDQVIEDPGGGTDTVESSASFVLSANVENLILTGAATTAVGNAGANTLTGTAANNILNGSGGADVMIGGGGNDQYFVDNFGDQAIETSAADGTDIVRSSASFTLGQFIENLTLTGNAGVNGTGNGLDNVITGNNGANVIDGGLGADKLKGGGDADNFEFTSALGSGNVDQLLDFVVGTDAIVLENGVFTGLAAGPLAAAAFRTGTVALDPDDRIIFDQATGNLYFDSDGTGATAQILFATLDPTVAGLSAADFIVI